MKKLLLGLCFTVGVSGLAFANDLSINSEENYLKLKQSEICNIDEYSIIDVLDCYYAYYTRSYNCDGSFNTIPAGEGPGACGSNADGSVVFVITRVDGCPTGGQKEVGIYP